jgi:hypothetical protein
MGKVIQKEMIFSVPQWMVILRLFRAKVAVYPIGQSGWAWR